VLLVLVFVLKESLRTKLQSLFWSLSLMVKSLSWFLLLKSLSWSLMKSLCFCPCVQCYFKGNYTLSNAELLTYLLTYLLIYLHSLRPSHYFALFERILCMPAASAPVERIFAARCYASAAYVVMRCLSVCLSVRLSRS